MFITFIKKWSFDLIVQKVKWGQRGTICDFSGVIDCSLSYSSSAAGGGKNYWTIKETAFQTSACTSGVLIRANNYVWKVQAWTPWGGLSCRKGGNDSTVEWLLFLFLSFHDHSGFIVEMENIYWALKAVGQSLASRESFFLFLALRANRTYLTETLKFGGRHASKI